MESLKDNVYSRYNWIYLDDQFIYNRFRSLNSYFMKAKYDLLWLNTDDSKHLMFVLLKLKFSRMKLLVNVHELNSFFKPTFGFNIKLNLRSISKKVLATVTDAYMVNDRGMKSYIGQHRLTGKPCFVISPVYYKGTNPPFNADKFIVVIAGTVDLRRRDYLLALNAWKNFVKEQGTASELILAGIVNNYGLAVKTKLNDDTLLKQTVKIFDHEIPETEFQRIITDATVLLSPLRVSTSVSGNATEEYGVTKTSGNLYDAIRYAKPYLVPDFLIVPEEIRSSTIKFEDENDLKIIFKKLSTESSWLEMLYSHAISNSKKFNYQLMRQQILDMIAAISTP